MRRTMSLRKSPSPSTQHPPNPKRTKGKLQCPICRSRLYGARRHYRERPNLRFQCTGCLTWLVYGEGVPSSKSQTFWVLEGADIVIHEPQCKEGHGDPASRVLLGRHLAGRTLIKNDKKMFLRAYVRRCLLARLPHLARMGSSPGTHAISNYGSTYVIVYVRTVRTYVRTYAHVHLADRLALLRFVRCARAAEPTCVNTCSTRS